jgi:hypothetical protein
MQNLFGEVIRPKPAAAPRTAKTRQQHRRKDWEDYSEPQFYSGDLQPATSSEVSAAVDGVPDVIREPASICAARFREPIRVPEGVPATVTIGENGTSQTVEATRIIKQAVFHMRHARRMPLRVSGDCETMPDYVESLSNIGRFARQLYLIDSGFRDAAHCIHRVRPDDPTSPYRVQPWDFTRGPLIDENRPELGRAGGHVHVGYAATEAEAWDKLAAWWLKNRKRALPQLKLSGTPLSDLTIDLLAPAAALQARMLARMFADDDD